MITDIPPEILDIILKKLDYISLCKVRLVSKDLSVLAPLMKIKIKKMNILYTFQQFTNKAEVTHKCINSDCINKNKSYYSNICGKTIIFDSCLGPTYFYYPDKLLKNENLNKKELVKRKNQCLSAPYHKQYIHYCEDCMVEANILIPREDGIEMPYGKNKDILN